jgi:hypothetical protein
MLENFDSFNFLAFDLVKHVREIEPYYDTLSEFEKERLKLAGLITRLQPRNLVLAQLVYLRAATFLKTWNTELDTFQPRRGKKEHDGYPTKAIMEILKCSRRTAQAYKLALKGIRQINRIEDLMFCEYQRRG